MFCLGLCPLNLEKHKIQQELKIILTGFVVIDLNHWICRTFLCGLCAMGKSDENTGFRSSSLSYLEGTAISGFPFLDAGDGLQFPKYKTSDF